jgi:Ca-activated chloride channel homolog
MSEALQYFHFLRPLWLLALPLIALLWWRVRRGHTGKTGAGSQPGMIAPHLAAALQVGSQGQGRILPIDAVALGLVTLAVAGPAWTRAPDPLVGDTAPLVVALKVTDTMLTPDLAPTRLDRARFKVLDLIGARAGARTALIAYAGSAHNVSPLTEDPNILRPLLEGLSPEVMPRDGANAGAALELATQVLQGAGPGGAVLFVLDDLDPGDIAAFNAASDPPRPPVIFLLALPEGQDVSQLGQINNARVVRMSADGTDVARIARQVRAGYAAALAGDERLQWQDRGWWLVWPTALLALLWFRRGWTMRWGVVVMLGLMMPGDARAENWKHWFATPDQQGQIAFNNKDFARAGDLFQDPYRRGVALLRAGKYAKAAEILARVDSAEAAFAQAYAHVRNREYRPAIAAYEVALERRPDFPEAATNLEITRAILIYVEDAREASDTGEDSGIGADDVVFDNEDGRGAETQVEAPEDSAPLTAEQWMAGIDTDMGDFLRSRFMLDNEARKP